MGRSVDGAQRWRSELERVWSNDAGALLRVAYRILQDMHAAEDACQAAFVKGCEQSADRVDCSRVKAWATTVVVNESLQQLRRRRKERPLTPTVESRQCDAGMKSDPWLRDAVMEGLNDLPDVTRVVVALRIIDGMSGNAVKELLGCSGAEVSRRLHQGMELLRVRLAALRCEAR